MIQHLDDGISNKGDTLSLFLSHYHTHTHTNVPPGYSAAHSQVRSRSRAARKSWSDNQPRPSQPFGNTAERRRRNQAWPTRYEAVPMYYNHSIDYVVIIRVYTLGKIHENTWMASLGLWRHLFMAPSSRFFRPAHETSSIPCRTKTRKDRL